MGLATSRGERPGALGRNTFGGPPVFNLDANLSKSFKIKEHQQIDGRFEVFNSTNHFNVSGINTVIGLDLAHPVSTFGRPTATSPARQFQFVARYSF